MRSSKVKLKTNTAVFVCVRGWADVCEWSTNMWAIQASMWTSSLRLAALDLWDSHPAHCVRHVPPFETWMAPAECVWLSEWVITELGRQLAVSCVWPGAPCVKTPGEDNTLHVLFVNSMLWPYVLQSCHLIHSLMYVLYCSSAVVRVADPFSLCVGWYSSE